MSIRQRQQTHGASRPPDKEAWKTGERGRKPLPLGGYAALIGLFGAGVAGLMTWANDRDRLLDDVSLRDLAVLGLGSQRLARMVSKDRVGTVLRQHFTEYNGTTDALPGESSESARRDGSSIETAIGELLVCPYCMSSWSTAALFDTYLTNPKLGRTLGALLSSISLAEVLQGLYTKIGR